ncbi:MAG: Hsp70 family protein [Myxococcota bacterium]
MPQTDIVLGIDLGNSYSTAAAWIQGKLYTVPDRRGEPCIPSIVYFPPKGLPVVGAEAERYRMAEPDATVSGIKRVLGRAADSPELRVFEAHSAVSVCASAGSTPILRTRVGEHTPAEVASYIFRHLKERAEARFHNPIKKAVVTLPATATPSTEEATRSAAKMAGLEVLRTLSEPSAAAIAYHLDRADGPDKLLVYDFGGGTFDATILEHGQDGFRTLGVGGDGCLGGDDFDHVLASQVASYIFRTYRVDVTRDVVRWERLIRIGETTKKALSAREVAPFRMPDAFSHQRKAVDIDLALHRDDLEPKWQPLIERSVKATADVLMRAGLRPEHLDATVMVGGTTFVPLVRRAVDRLMGKPGIVAPNPQTAVACGAAIVASRIQVRAA